MKKRSAYESYVEQFHASLNKKSQAWRGKADELRLYSEEEFNRLYRYKKDEYAQMVSTGKRKAIGNVIRGVLSDQLYPYSKEQALRIRELLIQQGETDIPTLNQLRAGMRTNTFYDEAQSTYRLLRSSGYSGTEAKHVIASSFFGS